MSHENHHPQDTVDDDITTYSSTNNNDDDTTNNTTSSSYSSSSSSLLPEHTFSIEPSSQSSIISSPRRSSSVLVAAQQRRSIASGFESLINGYTGDNNYYDTSYYQPRIMSQAMVLPGMLTNNDDNEKIEIVLSGSSGGDNEEAKECTTAEYYRSLNTTTTTTINNDKTKKKKKHTKIVPIPTPTSTAAHYQHYSLPTVVQKRQQQEQESVVENREWQQHHQQHGTGSFEDNSSIEATKQDTKTSNEIHYEMMNSTATTITTATTTMVQGARVYIRDTYYSWLPATIISPGQDNQLRVRVRIDLPSNWEDFTILPSTTTTTTKTTAPAATNTTIDTTIRSRSSSRNSFAGIQKRERLIQLSEYKNHVLPMQNDNNNNRNDEDDIRRKEASATVTEDTTTGKADMADLTHLHEASILYNLKARHASYLPYTRVGDILVAVNPFRWIEGMYSKEKQDFYAHHLIWQEGYYRREREELQSDTCDEGQQQRRRRSSLQLTPRATAASERTAIGYDYEKLGIQPHVYETSSLAYLGLLSSNCQVDQTIITTGESGAGKTETIKIVMNHLATIEQSRPSSGLLVAPSTTTTTTAAAKTTTISTPSDTVQQERLYHRSDSSIVTKVIQANPLFEAFGNAKTLRNDNSSRFGKFTQLQFEAHKTKNCDGAGGLLPLLPSSCQLVGSKCITYLLEKSRVVCATEGERSFHIFYQLLGAPEDEKRAIWEAGLVGKSTVDFAYLNNSSSSQDEKIMDAKNWPETMDALTTFGIHGEMFYYVARALCIVLQLGNIVFQSELQDKDGTERSVISNNEEMEKLSSLLGVPFVELETALTTRRLVTRGEEFVIVLSPSEAKDGCDALAKEIYAKVFDILVRKCNEATEFKIAQSADYYCGTISLLDIFGFESFNINRFEQLCINYANERLQQKYVLDNFYAIKNEYEEEGVNVFDFSLIDNSDVMELLEGKLGLISQLNEECVKKGAGGDEIFVYKFKVVNSDSDRIIQDHLHRPYEFGIRHYAAPITYDARKFIERNLDKIPTDLLKCVGRSTTNPLIRQEFLHLSAQLEKPTKLGGFRMRSESTKHLVFSKFKHQLTTLMSLIEKSRTRYIRCVKPNKEMIPRVMDHSHTVAQLESAGLATAIVISRESFPNRLSYDIIMKRFSFLEYKFPGCHLNSGNIKVDVETLLNHLLAGRTVDSHQGKVKPFACGKSRVYFRAGALDEMETLRQDYYAERAIQLQAWMRSLFSRRRFVAARLSVIRFQSSLRCWIARSSFAKNLTRIVTIQCFIRSYRARKELTRRRKENAAVLIQTRWRGLNPRRKYKAIRNATIRIQCFRRMIMEKRAYESKKNEIAEQRAMETRMTMIQQTFDDASTLHQGTVFSVDEGLLDEVESMFQFLRKEIMTLRKKNTHLKKSLAEVQSEKKELCNRSSSVDHALAVARIRNEQLNKTNMSLLDDNNRRRKEVNRLKNELTTQQHAHESQLQGMRLEFDVAMKHRDLEVQSMARNLQITTSSCKREVQQARGDAKRKQERQCHEMSMLREEMKGTQDSHYVYMSKLMDILESTQESRRCNSVSDGVLIQQKDEKISELQNEIARLRLHQEQASTSQDAKNDLKAMKHLIKKNREHRKSQVQYLSALTRQLEESLESCGADISTSSQVQKLLVHLQETINTGEKSNSRMDREMVHMIDNCGSHVPSQRQGGADDVLAVTQLLTAENQKLRRELFDKKYTCKKCGCKKGNKKKKNDGDGTVDEATSAFNVTTNIN